jgi:SAM-dependent methyltransferase
MSSFRPSYSSATSNAASSWSIVAFGLTTFIGGAAFGYAIHFYSSNVETNKIQRKRRRKQVSTTVGVENGLNSNTSLSVSSLSSSPTATANLSNKGAAESHLWKLVEYSLSATIIQAADRLDLFERLYEVDRPITVKQLADATKWSDRWLQEVLLQLTASGICTYDPSDQTFTLKDEYVPFLRGPQKEKRSLAGMFQFLRALTSRTDAVVQAVQTGVGIDYEHGIEDIGTAIDRKNGNFFKHTLVDGVLASIIIPQNGVPLITRLHEGIYVADVGCGFGTSTIAMAKRFPNSHFYAYESSLKALQSIQKNIDEAQISNVTICDVSQRVVGDGPILDDPTSMFGFVYAHDVLHDMLHPQELIKDVKKRLSKDDGCWLIVDIDCKETMEENLRLPNAATLYGFSCLLCLSMATSEPDGEGLGTCGFPPTLAKNWAQKAGFVHFQQRTVDAIPYNAVYLLA